MMKIVSHFADIANHRGYTVNQQQSRNTPSEHVHSCFSKPLKKLKSNEIKSAGEK